MLALKCNNAFVEISVFAREEPIDQERNIAR
jgi:hypothetical protein